MPRRVSRSSPRWSAPTTSPTPSVSTPRRSTPPASSAQPSASEMAGPDDPTNAVGLTSATFNAARIIGPALAGLMIGAMGGGAQATGWVILINALSYGAVIWQLAHMDATLLHSPKPVA